MMHTIWSLAFGTLWDISLKTTEKRKQDDLIMFAKEDAIMNLDKLDPENLNCACSHSSTPHVMNRVAAVERIKLLTK